MQPLKDIRVVAVTGFLAGPYASMNFARLGAEVIKVELPGKGDPVRGNGPFIGPEGKHPQQQTPDDISTRFLKRNQGVKSVTLNLKHPQGRKMFLDLAKSSDVMLENLAPGSLTRMGLGYKDVSAVNPEIIYCSISGYGQTGEYADRPAHDPQIQGMSGLMEINGHPDGPPTRVGFLHRRPRDSAVRLLRDYGRAAREGAHRQGAVPRCVDDGHADLHHDDGYAGRRC